MKGNPTLLLRFFSEGQQLCRWVAFLSFSCLCSFQECKTDTHSVSLSRTCRKSGVQSYSWYWIVALYIQSTVLQKKVFNRLLLCSFSFFDTKTHIHTFANVINQTELRVWMTYSPCATCKRRPYITCPFLCVCVCCCLCGRLHHSPLAILCQIYETFQLKVIC